MGLDLTTRRVFPNTQAHGLYEAQTWLRDLPFSLKALLRFPGLLSPSPFLLWPPLCFSLASDFIPLSDSLCLQ